MDGLKDGMNGMEDNINFIEGNMQYLKEYMEGLNEGLKNLLQEKLPNGKKVVAEMHDEKNINVNHDIIESNVGFNTHHIQYIYIYIYIYMREFMARIL